MSPDAVSMANCELHWCCSWLALRSVRSEHALQSQRAWRLHSTLCRAIACCELSPSQQELMQCEDPCVVCCWSNAAPALPKCLTGVIQATKPTKPAAASCIILPESCFPCPEFAGQMFHASRPACMSTCALQVPAAASCRSLPGSQSPDSQPSTSPRICFLHICCRRWWLPPQSHYMKTKKS